MLVLHLPVYLNLVLIILVSMKEKHHEENMALMQNILWASIQENCLQGLQTTKRQTSLHICAD